MKVAIITDTHWGYKKSSKIFHEYFENFYTNVFFPTLEKEQIDTIIHMGDAFDNRKHIEFWGLDWTKRVVLDPLRKYNVHMVVGNHDIFYKNSNSLNSPSLLLKNYDNIKVYELSQDLVLDDLTVGLVPWICESNYDHTMDYIENTDAKILLGHFEINGFAMSPGGHKMERSHISYKIFDKFDRVYSGHFHTRSDNGKIYYLGNPYEMFWADVDDPRGFHIFDTKLKEHKSINNPYTLFKNVRYNNDDYRSFNYNEYINKIVRIIVEKKTNLEDFENFVYKFFEHNVHDLKVIENFTVSKTEEYKVEDSEDTFALLNQYVESIDVNLDKTEIKEILNEIYKESSELVS